MSVRHRGHEVTGKSFTLGDTQETILVDLGNNIFNLSIKNNLATPNIQIKFGRESILIR